MIHIDPLKLYFGEDFQASDTVKVSCPTVKDIAYFGEQEYYSMVHTLVAIPSDMKSRLWDMGLDWEEVSDFELFIMLSRSLPQSKTYLLLGDVDLSCMKIYQHPNIEDEIVLADKEHGIVIDSYTYLKMAEYIRQMHGLKKKVERAKNKITKRVLIEDDRRRIERSAETKYKSFLYPLVSAIKVRMGYTLDYIGQMHIVEFMDDLRRLQIITQSDALLHGMYGGMINAKEIDKKILDWTRPFDNY